MSNAAAAGRKKSVISTAGLQIDTPIAHNTFLNKSAATSTSLYQQCSQLRARLLLVHGFTPYFVISSGSETRTSVDPVTQLWDCFALGVPLCFLHNLLPNVTPIASIDTDPASIDVDNGKAVKKAIVHFAMAISNNPELNDTTEQFIATQLLDRRSTDGFVKVCGYILSHSQAFTNVASIIGRKLRYPPCRPATGRLLSGGTAYVTAFRASVARVD